MILSYKHKFIFIKTRKTAGTSIEIALSRFCGKDDIITPISPEDEKIRKKIGVKPQNYHDKGGLLKKLKPKKKFSQHISARKIQEKIDSHIWDSYFKFCFERNPWDKTVSVYFFDKKFQGYSKDLSFEDYLQTDRGKEFPQFNYPLYTKNDSVIVDFIGKYENLQSDLKIAYDKIGIDFDDWMPHAKGGYRTEKKHYSSYYNEASRKLVETHFNKEIDLFGYKFEKLRKN